MPGEGLRVTFFLAKHSGDKVMIRMIDHLYIFASIGFGIYSQLIMRWQVSQAGHFPSDHTGKIYYVLNLLLNPWIMTGVVSTFFAGVCWMLAMTKFEISYAYPWMSLSFIIVMVFSALFLHESLSYFKVLGSTFIVLGIFIISRG